MSVDGNQELLCFCLWVLNTALLDFALTVSVRVFFTITRGCFDLQRRRKTHNLRFRRCYFKLLAVVVVARSVHSSIRERRPPTLAVRTSDLLHRRRNAHTRARWHRRCCRSRKSTSRVRMRASSSARCVLVSGKHDCLSLASTQSVCSPSHTQAHDSSLAHTRVFDA